MTKVERVEIVNFKGLKGLKKDLNGNSVFVVGANGSGKSSFIDAVFCALTGKDLPTEIINTGKTEAKVEVELTDGTAVIVEFKKKKEKVEQKLTLVIDGEIVKESPRARLNDLVKTVNFDPFEFMAMSPKEKLDYFCKVAGVNTSDIDAEYKENLDLINIEKRELKKHDLEPYDEQLAAAEPVKASDLLNELQEAQKKNRTIEEFETKVKALETDNDHLNEQIQAILSRIEENKANIVKGKDWLAKQTKIDLEPIQKKVNEADKTNENIRKAKEAKESNEKREKLIENIEAAETANKGLRAKKESLISKALEGIDGMTFDGEQFLLNGLPFEKEQNNTSAQIIAGLKIGMKLLGEVRIARFEGSLLDNDNLDAVNKWAAENDLQLFVELVDLENGELKLEIVES